MRIMPAHPQPAEGDPSDSLVIAAALVEVLEDIATVAPDPEDRRAADRVLSSYLTGRGATVLLARLQAAEQ